jgi:hypothetical protein
MTFYHVFLLNAALLTTTFSSKFGPPLPLPPADLPPPILPSFGPNYGAVPQGSRTAKSGKYHYPFYKFSIGTIMQSPAYRGCCRVCPEQFGIEVSLLLEVSSQQNVRESVRHRKGGDGGAMASLGGAKGGAGAASPVEQLQKVEQMQKPGDQREAQPLEQPLVGVEGRRPHYRHQQCPPHHIETILLMLLHWATQVWVLV